jgi:hypothetical protein
MVAMRLGQLTVAAMSFVVVACSSTSSVPSGDDTQTDAGRAGTAAGAAGTTSTGGNAGSTSTAGSGNAGNAGTSSGGAGGGFAGASGNGGSVGSSDAGTDGGSAGTSGMAGSSGSAGVAGNAGSAGTSGMGGAAGSGGTAYNPCPIDGSPCKILPFGDSITRGVKSSDDAGYRSQLFKLVVAAKQKVSFTGSLTNGPAQVSGQPFPQMHEGHPGWTIDPGYNTSGNYGGISSLVPSPALNGSPHIILLHIGTNDVFARDTANMSTRLEALVDKIAQNAPSALIVLAKITPLSSSNTALTTYNGKIPGIVQSHAVKGQHIVGVDMSQLPIATDLSSDGTHPNDRGYAYMAGVWYAAIQELLPK